MPIIVIIIIILVVVFSIINRKKEKERQAQERKNHQEFMRKQEIENQKYEQELNKAKVSYEEALNGKDKKDALIKGRIYYALLRNGISALSEDYTTELSSRDESRIRTDLQTMKVES